MGDERYLNEGNWIAEIVDTESLVPKDHLLRKIDAAIEFNRLYEIVEPLYCEDNGRPSVDPVVLFKMVLIRHLNGDSAYKTPHICKKVFGDGKVLST